MPPVSLIPTFRSDEKFKELVLYISGKCAQDGNFGATKLNKILFFSDFLAYRTFGQAITGHPYQKLQFGPAPLLLLPMLGEMEADGDCSIETRNRFGHVQKRVVAHREASLTEFSGPEIALVDTIIEGLESGNATELSNFSHIFPGWRAADLQEEIPYVSAFVGAPRDLSAGEIKYGQSLA